MNLCLKKNYIEQGNEDLYKMLGIHSLPYFTVARWCAKFKQGRTLVNDPPTLRSPRNSSR